jgi:hypothetical protein
VFSQRLTPATIPASQARLVVREVGDPDLPLERRSRLKDSLDQLLPVFVVGVGLSRIDDLDPTGAGADLAEPLRLEKEQIRPFCSWSRAGRNRW